VNGQTRHHAGRAELHGAHLAVVWLVQLPEQIWRPSSNLINEITALRAIHHVNLLRFVGLCLDEENFCLYLLEEAFEKGTLVELMGNESTSLDDVFKLSFLKDIVEVSLILLI
jgi:hypothetical protein